MKNREPSKLEMQVLSLLWERGSSTVREIQEALPDGKTRAYTTVLTVLQVMEKKGFVNHTSQGNAHLYSPKVSAKQTIGPLMKNLVRNLFGGSPSAVFQHLLDEDEVSHEELARLKALIQEREKSGGKNVKKGGS